MSLFLPVNRPVSPSKDVVMDGVSPPTTPRPAPATTLPSISDHMEPDSPTMEEDSQALSQASNPSQKPPSPESNGDDITVAESEADKDHSDHDPDDTNGPAPPSKKKKGQRFFCTDFPPCSLSFTRSEHLARHIRKHTGERPFQCHCSRRFSRLDNLRQHAQTVHVNEEIPGDSLAATGMRFPRTMRTDRVRQSGRSRAGTTGSQSGHPRGGHGRNLSTSSITSVASTASTYSNRASDLPRRPPPLIMAANDAAGRPRRGIDSLGEPPTTPPPQLRTVPGQSPSTYATFVAAGAVGGGSPHFGSPISASRGSDYWGNRAQHIRRLSVPSSGGNPFVSQPGPGNTYPPPYISSVPSSHGTYSNSGSVYGSPTTSSYVSSRDEQSPTEAELRRRTWHPSTYSAYPRPATSGLSHYETPDSYRSIFPGNNPSSTAADQPTRLPGIESFDKVIPQNRPVTPPFRKPSPMQVDSPHRLHPAPPTAQGYSPGFASPQAPGPRPQPPIAGSGHRRGHVSWDISWMSKDSSSWGQQTLGEIQHIALRPITAAATSSPSNQPESLTALPEIKSPPERPAVHNRPAWPDATSAAPQSRTSPEDSSSSEGVTTPSTSTVETHPAIVHSNGYVERSYHHRHLSADPNQISPVAGSQPTFLSGPAPSSNGMGRLEALVAVATSESKDTSRFF